MRFTRFTLLVAAALLLWPGLRLVQAAQCDVTATSLGFGSYDPLDPAPLGATATLEIRCKPPNKVFTVIVLLSAGNGSLAQRVMSAPGGGTLLYNVYLDPAFTTIFGDGSGGSATAAQTVAKTAPWTLPVYGRIPALQNIPPGAYADILTATILY